MSQEDLDIFLKPVSTVRGISTKREEQLEKLDIRTVSDLLCHFPRRYEDWTKIKAIVDLQEEQDEVFLARIETVPSLYRRGKMSMLNVTVRDDSAVLKITWFNQPYYQDRLELGKIYLFRGRIKRKGLKFAATNPKFFITTLDKFPHSDEEWEKITSSSFVEPVYPATQGITQTYLRKWTQSALKLCLPNLEEYLYDSERQRYHLADLAWSFKQIHQPEQIENYDIARRRLAFDELLFLQLNMLSDKSESERKSGLALNLQDKEKLQLWASYIKSLDFELTKAQSRALEDVLKDMSKNIAMNRLLQGDVGSGKTIVAFLSMIWAALHGKQAVLMAPTAILATQHFQGFKKIFSNWDEGEIALLTGQSSAKEKKEIYSDLESGKIKILIGTHALIEDKVNFKELALAVTDEQHRFGVKQRLGLAEGTLAHVLVMSATPIPRTLGLLLYGDLDVSVLREKPAGRKDILTYTARTKDKARLYDLMRKNESSKGQTYVVCPMVEDSDAIDVASVERTYEEIKSAIPELEIALLHGQMKEDKKNIIMSRFLSGEIRILVSTTVIEVGVDNPNATMMIIVNSERFGLSTLHQLRGRIGRGDKQSLCVLLSDVGKGKARERLTSLCKSQDGFEIAEADLSLRGPGDIFGTRQHGVPSLKMANLYEDTELIQQSSELARQILAKDPNLETDKHKILAKYLEIYRGRLYLNA